MHSPAPDVFVFLSTLILVFIEMERFDQPSFLLKKTVKQFDVAEAKTV